VKVNVVVPLLPSASVTSLIESVGSTGPQGLSGLAELRGAAAAAVKSEPLLSVSEQPPEFRKIDAVVLVAGPTVPSKKFALPHPTKSIKCERWVGVQGVLLPLHAIPVVVSASRILPAVPAMLIVVELRSGVGNGTPLAPPAS